MLFRSGSGHGWWDRNVTLWVWADGVELTAARDSVLAKVAELVAAAPPTTLASTTTTVAPVVPAAAAPGCTAESATVSVTSARPRPVEFTGTQIGEAAMAALWEYGSTHGPHDFGTVIGAAHNWLGACSYPGIGLGTGSGHGWWDRNVTLWVWADEVNLDVARGAVMDLVSSLVPVGQTEVAATAASSAALLAAALPKVVALPNVEVSSAAPATAPRVSTPATKAASARAVPTEKVTRAPVKQTRRPAKARVRPLATR